MFYWCTKVFVLPPITDNDNVGTKKRGDHTVALTESPYAVRFEANTLKSWDKP